MNEDHPVWNAAMNLSKECPLRLAWWIHLRGGCRHYLRAKSPTIKCFQQDEIPDGFTPTPAQTAFDTSEGMT